jgi:hypothetical protein
VISLFPLLSVLASVIGIITLLIATVAMGNFIADHAVERQEQYQEIESKIKETQLENDALAAQMKDARALPAQIESAKRRLQQLQERLKQGEAQMKPSFDLKEQAAKLEALIAKLEEELKRTSLLLADRRKLFDNLREEMKQSAETGKIVLQPGGSGRGLEPHFVECSAEGVMVHSSLYDGKARLDRKEAAGALKGFFKKVGARKEASVIFLIRQDGVPAYEEMAAAAREVKVRIGKLPVPGRGEIDFSLFSKLKG